MTVDIALFKLKFSHLHILVAHSAMSELLSGSLTVNRQKNPILNQPKVCKNISTFITILKHYRIIIYLYLLSNLRPHVFNFP